MTLLRTNQDTVTLVDDLFDSFKDHLRILDLIEDDLIKIYLAGAIDAIGIFRGNEIWLTTYEVYEVYEYGESQLGADKWYCGKWNISNEVIRNSNGDAITGEYVIDHDHGMFYPSPLGNDISFDVGYADGDNVPANLKNIIFRYGAELYENRESIRIGDPKQLPGWVNYAMASIWKPGV